MAGIVSCAKNKIMNKVRTRLYPHGQTSFVPSVGDEQVKRQFQRRAISAVTQGAVYKTWWFNSRSRVLPIFPVTSPSWPPLSLPYSADTGSLSPLPAGSIPPLMKADGRMGGWQSQATVCRNLGLSSVLQIWSSVAQVITAGLLCSLRPLLQPGRYKFWSSGVLVF